MHTGRNADSGNQFDDSYAQSGDFGASGVGKPISSGEQGGQYSTGGLGTQGSGTGYGSSDQYDTGSGNTGGFRSEDTRGGQAGGYGDNDQSGNDDQYGNTGRSKPSTADKLMGELCSLCKRHSLTSFDL